MDPSQKAVLDSFLADNDELAQLSARLATFNIFRALKVEDAEIRHSNTLGWLLDPGESHGLGDVFLRRIFSNMLLQSDFDGLSAAQVELMEFRNIDVRREWKHIDVLVIDRDNRLLLLIENKLGCGESPGQLARYHKIAASEFPGFKLVPVFLTLEGDSVEDDDACCYICYSHRQLLDVLRRIIDQRRAQVPEAVLTFLMHYIDTLRRLTMQDTELVDLCKAIYGKHREAIDLIARYGMTSNFLQSVLGALKQTGEFEILWQSSAWVVFIPNTWKALVPENGQAWKQLSRPVSIACWLAREAGSVRLVFEVSKMTDPQLRLKYVKDLEQAGFKPRKKAFEEDAVYSRVYSDSEKVADFTDDDLICDAVNKLMAKAKQHFVKAEDVLKRVSTPQA